MYMHVVARVNLVCHFSEALYLLLHIWFVDTWPLWGLPIRARLPSQRSLDLPVSTSQCRDCKCSPHTVGRHVCSWKHIKGWWDVAAIFFCSSYCLKIESVTEPDTCHWGLSWPGSSWIRGAGSHVLAFCWDLNSDPRAREQVLSPMPSSPTTMLALCGLWGSNWVFTLAW